MHAAWGQYNPDTKFLRCVLLGENITLVQSEFLSSEQFLRCMLLKEKIPWYKVSFLVLHATSGEYYPGTNVLAMHATSG